MLLLLLLIIIMLVAIVYTMYRAISSTITGLTSVASLLVSGGSFKAGSSELHVQPSEW